MTKSELKSKGYYPPTSGENVGTWNVFHTSGKTDHNVKYDDLPNAVKAYMEGHKVRLRDFW